MTRRHFGRGRKILHLTNENANFLYHKRLTKKGTLVIGWPTNYQYSLIKTDRNSFAFSPIINRCNLLLSYINLRKIITSLSSTRPFNLNAIKIVPPHILHRRNIEFPTAIRILRPRLNIGPLIFDTFVDYFLRWWLSALIITGNDIICVICREKYRVVQYRFSMPSRNVWVEMRVYKDGGPHVRVQAPKFET